MLIRRRRVCTWNFSFLIGLSSYLSCSAGDQDVATFLQAVLLLRDVHHTHVYVTSQPVVFLRVLNAKVKMESWCTLNDSLDFIWFVWIMIRNELGGCLMHLATGFCAFDTFNDFLITIKQYALVCVCVCATALFDVICSYSHDYFCNSLTVLFNTNWYKADGVVLTFYDFSMTRPSDVRVSLSVHKDHGFLE